VEKHIFFLSKNQITHLQDRAAGFDKKNGKLE
jgi:hypothetical protein